MSAAPTHSPSLRILDLRADHAAVSDMVNHLRLSPVDLALLTGVRAERAKAVAAVIEDVANRGDAALVDLARRFDDPHFTPAQLRVTRDEMTAAHARVSPDLLRVLRKSIAQVREYQSAILPPAKPPLTPRTRPGFSARLRWTPLSSAGLYFPGGQASYPSSLIMLAVPAQVAGVPRLVACTPASKHFSDPILAVALELGLTEIYRVGGAGAIAAMALGTQTIPAVDKILGPGNDYVQLAKRAVAGAVGTDGYAGPSEILVIADQHADAPTIAADMLAQAEHDPGSCFLVSTSRTLIENVQRELSRQLATLPRHDALARSLRDFSAAVLCPDENSLLELANAIACEHVSLRVADADTDRILSKLTNAGCIFVGTHSPVAAGDYIAGPSHCLPTNTTARFASGVSVYEFLKRSSIVQYSPQGIAQDAPDIATFARAEGLEAHARSAEIRLQT
jgi:histidinol dehydrogenase